jgi:nucleoside-diphosphate-sugar epimerase
MPSHEKRCILTGSTGYLGTYLKASLERDGWKVISWNRHPSTGSDDISFHLGQAVDPEKLKDAQALVHCAYDLEPRNWPDIYETNVAGSKRLFEAAHAAKITSLVFVSSISAFPGCRSHYGRAKLEIETIAQDCGGTILRPGLIYGDQPGGMFGRLVQQARTSRLIPIPSGGRQTQHLVHQEDLTEIIKACLHGRIQGGTEPIIVAHERGWELRDLLAALARASGTHPLFVPVPWQLAWAGLRTLECAGVRLAFRSDSLISMVYQAVQASTLWLGKD